MSKKPKDVQNVIRSKKLIDMYDKAGNGENSAINMAKSGTDCHFVCRRERCW